MDFDKIKKLERLERLIRSYEVLKIAESSLTPKGRKMMSNLDRDIQKIFSNDPLLIFDLMD